MWTRTGFQEADESDPSPCQPTWRTCSRGCACAYTLGATNAYSTATASSRITFPIVVGLQPSRPQGLDYLEDFHPPHGSTVTWIAPGMPEPPVDLIAIS